VFRIPVRPKLAALKTMESNNENNDAATSEVGSGSLPNTSIDPWRVLMEMQNKNFIELVKALKPTASETTNNNAVVLPKFNADLAGADASAWCATVNIILAENHIKGSALVMALSAALEGSASQWLSQICYPDINWAAFKELFLQRFTSVETPAAMLLTMLSTCPTEGECLSNYASRMVTSLITKWREMDVEEIAVCVTLAQLAHIDTRLQRLTFTSNVRTRSELQTELKAFTFNKRKKSLQEETAASDLKRQKFSTIKCHYCGKWGHKMVECRARQQQNLPTRAAERSGRVFGQQQQSNLTCYTCGEVGHISTHCSKPKMDKFKDTHQVKRVQLCEVDVPKGEMIHHGETFTTTFDSGAECSLVKQKISAKLVGKRINNTVMLKGIGNDSICSTLQILCKVKINNYCIEMLFHVLSDEYLKDDILIGREILSQGFYVTMSPGKFEIVRSKSVNFCSNDDVFSKLNTDLVGEDKDKLNNLLENYSKSFTKRIPSSTVSTGEMKIKLIDNRKIVQRRPYRLSPNERELVRDKIKELLECNVIRPSCSPFASPMMLVNKKDGSHRLCVDYRELNSNTVSDRYPLPLIADQIARLHGAKYFTCLDMASGYYQIPLHEESIECTAFVTPDGQYEFLSMPFGLKNAPSVFQRTVMHTLGELANTFVVVYMDDVLVVAATKNEAFERLQVTLDVLTKAGFLFNIKKCSFLKSTVQYLGYEVSAGQIRPNSQKISALTALPPPQSVSALRQFIGLASYFRQFIHGFSCFLKPLYLLTSERNEFIWKPEHEEVRQKVISVLTQNPVLVIFDPQHPIELHTDASARGYGAILLHRIDNRPHVVEFFSKAASPAESRYHSYELETLAVVMAIKHFRHYLTGRDFVVFTDCNSLKASRNKRDLSPRAQRWWAYLQSFSFELQYREGKRMAHADFFSRNLPTADEIDARKVSEKRINLAEISSDWLMAEQRKDPDIINIVNKLKDNSLAEDIAKTYELRAGIIYRKIQRNGRTRSLPIVPRSFRWSVINQVHETIMHLGWEKTLDKAYDFYWFENMSKYVRKFVENCITCKMSKLSSGKVQARLFPIPKVDTPWHTIHIDITGKLSGKSDQKEYVIVQVDAFTKFVYLTHTLKIDADNCIGAVTSAVSLFGVPNRIIADQGRCFASSKFSEFCSKQNISLHLIATGASRANGQVERIMSTLKNLLTAVETSSRSWQDALGEVQLALNCTVSRVTKASPLELFIGKVARPLGLLPPCDVAQEVDLAESRARAVQNISAAAAYSKEQFDKTKAKVVGYEVGDFVLLKNEERHQTKLSPKYRGPLQIVQVLDGDRYILKSLTNNRKFKYAHEDIRKLPEGYVPDDLESCDEDLNDIEKEAVARDSNEVIEKEAVARDSNEVIEKEAVARDSNEVIDKEAVERDSTEMLESQTVERDSMDA